MIYQFNSFKIDTEKFLLFSNGIEKSVEPQIFNLIVFLIINRDHIVSREDLLDNIWQGRVVSDTSINNSIKTARKVVGDDGQKQQVIKTIHSRGYQFVAKIDSLSKDDKSTNNTQDSPKIPNKPSSLLISFKSLVAIGAVLLALTTFSLWPPNKDKTTPNKTHIPSVAVLPFFNSSPNSESDYYGFALADQVIGALNYLKNITVRPSSTIRKYASQQFNPIDVGTALEVDYILSGYYTIKDNDIRLNTELVDMQTKEIVWRGKPIETSYSNTFRLQDIVARQVSEGLKLEFATERLNNIQQDVPQSPLAYEYYLRSIAYPYNTEGHRLAVAMLKQSIALDDQYAPAYIQLGNRTRRLAQFGLVESDTLPNTEQYYLKALSLNPELMDAMSHLAMLYTETNRINEAMELAQSMYQLNPNNANTHFTLGYIYRYAGMLTEAISEMEQAVLLDPKNIKFRSLIGSYSATGQYQKALDMTELYQPSPFTYGWQALMYNRLGNSEKALQLYDGLIKNHPNSLWANVALLHKSVMFGDSDTGLKAIDALVNTEVKDGETIYYTAAYYGLLGDKKRCLELLQKTVDNGYFNYQNISNNDYFDSVKSEPQFQKILSEAKSKQMAFRNKFFPNN